MTTRWVTRVEKAENGTVLYTEHSGNGWQVRHYTNDTAMSVKVEYPIRLIDAHWLSQAVKTLAKSAQGIDYDTIY